jgi:hypothetical protein
MALKLYTGKNSDIKVYASDWKIFVKALKEIDPQQLRSLRKRWRDMAGKTRKSIQEELKGAGAGEAGPMTGMRHGGRTGWGTNYGKVGSPVSGARRKPYDTISISTLEKNKKGATGIARLIVRSAGVVYADLANGQSGRAYTRMYKIREFGGPEIMRSHEVRPNAVSSFLSNLGPVVKQSKRKKSRNVYPGFDKAYPAVADEAREAIEETIRFVENNIDRNNK